MPIRPDHADLTARLAEVAHNLRADDEEVDAQAVDRGLALIAELRRHITALSGDVVRLTAERDETNYLLGGHVERLLRERDEALAEVAQLRRLIQQHRDYEVTDDDLWAVLAVSEEATDAEGGPRG